ARVGATPVVEGGAPLQEVMVPPPRRVVCQNRALHVGLPLDDGAEVAPPDVDDGGGEPPRVARGVRSVEPPEDERLADRREAVGQGDAEPEIRVLSDAEALVETAH